MHITYSKCYSMHFGVNNPYTVYKFGDADIKSESDIKDLGVFVSNYLKIEFISLQQINRQDKKVVFHVISLFEI